MQQFPKRWGISLILLAMSTTTVLADDVNRPPKWAPEPHSIVVARQRAWDNGGYNTDKSKLAVGRCADEYSSVTDFQACNPELFQSNGSDGGGSGGSAE